MVDPRPRMARLGFKKAIIELKVPEFVVRRNSFFITYTQTLKKNKFLYITIQSLKLHHYLPVKPLITTQVDQNYMLPLRPKQVTFSNLNNNVNLSFLTSMCSPYGPIHYHHIYYHPVSKAHLGLATVSL